MAWSRAVATVLIVLPSAVGLTPSTVYEAKVANFTFGTQGGPTYAEALASGQYKVSNCAITGIKVFESDIFLTVPRWRTGVPATLNKLTADGTLQPFPSWAMNRVDDCEAIQYVQSMEVDPVRKEMWVVDVGRKYFADPAGPDNTCPPKVVILSMPEGSVIDKFTLPDSAASYNNSFLNDIALNAALQVGYISNVGDAAITVFDRKTRQAWRFADASMRKDESYDITIDGIAYGNNASTGNNYGGNVDGIALTPDGTRILYCPLQGVKLWSIDAQLLGTYGASESTLAATITFLGNKPDISDGLAFDCEGTLWFGGLQTNSLYRWKYSPAGDACSDVSTATMVATSAADLHWIDTFAFNGTTMFVTTNKLDLYFTHRMKYLDATSPNFHTVSFDVGAGSYMYPCGTLGRASPVRVGCIGDLFHQLETAAVASVISARGYDVQTAVHGHTAAFDALFNGEVDILPSVWLPDGHRSFLEGSSRYLGTDYVILGITSNNAGFLWAANAAASAAGITSFDDLAGSKTLSWDLSDSILMCEGDYGLSINSLKIVAALNVKRNQAGLANFTVVNFCAGTGDAGEAHMYAFVAQQMANATHPFVAPMYTPSTYYIDLVENGDMKPLSSGTLGGMLGLMNSAATIAKPSFLASGKVDAVTLGQLAHTFLGDTFVNDANLAFVNANPPLSYGWSGAISSDVVDMSNTYLRTMPQFSYWYDVYTKSSTLITGDPVSMASPSPASGCLIPSMSGWVPEGFTYVPQLAGFVIGSMKDATAGLGFVNWDGSVTQWIAPTAGLATTFGIELSYDGTKLHVINASWGTPGGYGGPYGGVFTFDIASRQLVRAVAVSGVYTGSTMVLPDDCVEDASGNLYVTDLVNSIVYKIDPLGNPSILMRSPSIQGIDGISWHPSNFLIVSDYFGDTLYRVETTGVGEPRRLNISGGSVISPDGVHFTSDGGALLVTGTNANTVTKLTSADGWMSSATIIKQISTAPACITPSAGVQMGSSDTMVVNCVHGFSTTIPLSFLQVDFSKGGDFGRASNTCPAVPSQLKLPSSTSASSVSSQNDGLLAAILVFVVLIFAMLLYVLLALTVYICTGRRGASAPLLAEVSMDRLPSAATGAGGGGSHKSEARQE